MTPTTYDKHRQTNKEKKKKMRDRNTPTADAEPANRWLEAKSDGTGKLSLLQS